MATLNFRRSGTGPTLVLLHGLGSSLRVWDPVVASLAEHFDVLAVDLPGFGQSAPLATGVEPHPGVLASAVAELLDDLGVAGPHLVGNSLGGWVAMELAGIRPPASVTLLSPAGLWKRNTPRYNLVSLRATRWFARHCTKLLSRLVSYRVGRVLVLGQTHGRPARMSIEQARGEVSDMALSPGFEATLAATAARHLVAGGGIDCPVTVAFGSRDLLLRRRSRRVDQLPPQRRLVTLDGCGHVPTSDDPVAVTSVILTAASAAMSATR